MRSSVVARVCVVLIAVMFLPAGLQAAFAPRRFYDDFPIDRHWVAMVGPAYNEHLVRDVGGLFLAMCIVSIWAWWRPALCLPVAVAWLVQGVLHLAFHLGQLHHLKTFDKVAMVGSFVVQIVLAVVAIVAATGRARVPT